MNLRWPQTKEKPYYAPWYIVAWRAVWFPIIYALLAAIFVVTMLAYGKQRAIQFWTKNA